MTRTEESIGKVWSFRSSFCFSSTGDYYISEMMVKKFFKKNHNLISSSAQVDLFNISKGTALHSLKCPNLLCLQSGNNGEMFTASCFFLVLRTSCLYNDPELSSMEKDIDLKLKEKP
uniref:Prune-like protein 2 with BCH domain n=1 Tax=Molossus molossus TaxID=27622 RepID=A0A7J8EG22_MOLMO|nr:prune-like protein 2 with BCH domain [Molossus molossus]